MSNKINFTEDRVLRFAPVPDKKETFYRDDQTPGLGLRVTDRGVKSYIFETMLHGKSLRITIGDIGTYSVKDARKKAIELKQLTDSGSDPRKIKQEKREVAIAERETDKLRDVLVGNVWPEYLEFMKPRWSQSYYDNHLRFSIKGGQPRLRGGGVRKQGVLYPMLQVRMGELTPETLARWVNDELENDRPVMLNLAYTMLRGFANWAIARGYKGIIDPLTFNAEELRDVVPEKGAARENDCLQREQLSAWFKAVLNRPEVVTRTLLIGLLITGARRNEMATLEWENVDLEWNTLTIHDKESSYGGKDGKRTIPLTPYFRSLLLQMPKHKPRPGTKNYVFWSHKSKEGFLKEPRYCHKDALNEANLPHVTVHGLRRSFATLSEWVQVPNGVTAQIMGHKPSAIAEKHYRRRTVDLLRVHHTRLEQWMLKQAGIPFEYGELPAEEPMADLRLVA